MDLILPLVFCLVNNRKRNQNRLHQLRRKRRRPQKILKRATLEDFTPEETCHIFRMDKAGIIEVYNEIKNKLETPTKRSHALPGVTKLLAVMHYLASGSFQYCAAAKLGISQPSFSRWFPTVIDALVSLAPKYIKFPTTPAAIHANKLLFYSKAGFPNVLALIDCTHIFIVPPSEDEHTFRNRKQYHSLNVQLVCGPSHEILDVVAKFPGCSHDAYVLSNSRLGEKFQSVFFGDSILLGDNGYRNTSWLVTPYLNPTTPAEKKFNVAHRKTRGQIERVIGILKSRFRCLDFTGGAILYKPHLVGKIVVACCVLHNLANIRNVPVEVGEELHISNHEPGDYIGDSSRAGVIRRQTLTERFFNV